MIYVDMFDMFVIVCWLLLPITIGAFWMPIMAQTFLQVIVGIIACIIVNIFWLIGLAWLTKLGFNTDLGVVARAMVYDLAPFFLVGMIIRRVDGPYRPRLPSDPPDRYSETSHPFTH